MIYLAFAFELIAIVFLSYGIEKLWLKHVNNKILQICLYPGTVARILSQAILCLFTGATIKNLNIYKFQNNEVKFEKPKLSVVGNFFIAAAPIFGCGIVLLLLAVSLGNTAGEKQGIGFGANFKDHLRNLDDIIISILSSFLIHFKSAKIAPLIFVPLSVIFTVSMAPKKEDLKFLVIGFFTVGAIPFLMELSGASMVGNDAREMLLNGLWHLVTLSISVLLAILGITLIITGGIKGIKLTFMRKGGGGGGGKSGKSKGNDQANAIMKSDLDSFD